MLSHMDEVLGTRYCEPTAMKANMIMTRAMQLIMKGTFNRADLAGSTGTRWQMLDELVESCSAEDVGKLQDARGAPSGPASSMISTPRQRRAWRRLRIHIGGFGFYAGLGLQTFIFGNVSFKIFTNLSSTTK